MTQEYGGAPTSAPGVVRHVGLFTATCLLVSNMIGTGIFGSTGFMAADLGHPGWILGLWLLGMLYALAGALSYGELGAAMPRAGGEYVYIREAYGPLPAFLSGWTSFTIAFGGAIAVNADLFAGHLSELVHPGEGAWPGWVVRGRVVELSLVWFLTLVHCAGLGTGGLTQRLLTIVKVGAILLILAVAWWGKGSWANLTQVDPSVPLRPGVALVSFLFVTFAYSGWNASSYVASEIEDPARNLPRSMVRGTLLVGALYLGLNLVYLFALPVEKLAGESSDRHLVGLRALQALFGSGVGRWFTALLTVSIAGAVSAMIWAGPRVYSAMAADGVFPRWFASESDRTGVPVRSILLQGAWVSVLVLAGSFEALVKYASAVMIVFAGLGVSAVFVLRARAPQMPRPYRTWGYPLVPALYLAASAAVLFAALQQQLEAWRRGEAFGYLSAGTLTVLAGVPLYLVLGRRSAQQVR